MKTELRKPKSLTWIKLSENYGKFFLATLAVLLCSAQNSIATETRKSEASSKSLSKIRTTRNLASMPLYFTVNQGQWDEKVKFRANAGGATMWFAPDGAYYQFTKIISSEVDNSDSAMDKRSSLVSERIIDRKLDSVETMMIKASFVGANPNPHMVGVDLMEYETNYFIGNDPDEWHTNVPNYSAVLYKGIYDGIDLKYYGSGTQMEYDFIVEPGADYSQIEIRYEGAESISVNENGELIVTTKWGEVVEQKPLVYQVVGGTRAVIHAEYMILGENLFGFEMPQGFDNTFALVIDPVLSFSTYLGGSGREEGNSIEVDAAGAAYVTGHTLSDDFPTSSQIQNYQQSYDVFVTKLTSSGEELVYSTYLGGTGVGNESGTGIAVDRSGSAYVVGDTESDDFPTTLDAQDASSNGGVDVFVLKLNSSGNAIIYSSFLGGSGVDRATGVAVDGSEAAHLTGTTSSTDFPLLNSISPRLFGGSDAFVTKFNADGDSLVYSTFLGGSSSDDGKGIAVDLFGAAYIVGNTWSTDFPLANPFQSSKKGFVDVFVSKLSNTGDLVYSTYLGGSAGGFFATDFAEDIAVDSLGFAYVTGWTSAEDFPLLNPLQDSLRGERDIFITKLNKAGDSLVYSTYLGGFGEEVGSSIVVSASGRAYIAGYTISLDFPLSHPIQVAHNGLFDAFVIEMSNTGSDLEFSTLIGGNGLDGASGIALDQFGAIYIVGNTSITSLLDSVGFPTLNPFQSELNGSGDAFVTKIEGFSSVQPPMHCSYSTNRISVCSPGDTAWIQAPVVGANSYSVTVDNPSISVQIANDGLMQIVTGSRLDSTFTVTVTGNNGADTKICNAFIRVEFIEGLAFSNRLLAFYTNDKELTPPDSQSLALLSSCGSTSFEWTVSYDNDDDTSWLSVFPLTGTTSIDSTLTVAVAQSGTELGQTIRVAQLTVKGSGSSGFVEHLSVVLFVDPGAGLPDIVAQPGDIVEMPLYVNLDSTIGGFTIPLSYKLENIGAEFITLDTVIFDTGLGRSVIYINPDTSAGAIDTVVIVALPVPIRDPKLDTSKTVATLVFSISQNAPRNSVVTIDTVTAALNGVSYELTFFGETLADTVAGTFQPGTIELLDIITSITEIEDGSAILPESFKLHQNYPNPFNPSTTIEFDMAKKADVTLEVFNVLGQKVYNEAFGELSAGSYKVVWDASQSDAASGVYFYRLTVGDLKATRKMVLLK